MNTVRLSLPSRLRSRVLAVALTALTAFSLGAVATPPPAFATVESSFIQAVFQRMASERSFNHLPMLHWNPALALSARRHGLAMAATDTMSHQLSGEIPLGNRISAAGYRWRGAGENVAWTTLASAAGAVQMEFWMYHEVAPNDGHRRNILSGAFQDVGISIIVDNVHHRIWLTEDFGTPA